MRNGVISAKWVLTWVRQETLNTYVRAQNHLSSIRTHTHRAPYDLAVGAPVSPNHHHHHHRLEPTVRHLVLRCACILGNESIIGDALVVGLGRVWERDVEYRRVRERRWIGLLGTGRMGEGQYKVQVECAQTGTRSGASPPPPSLSVRAGRPGRLTYFRIELRLLFSSFYLPPPCQRS